MAESKAKKGQIIGVEQYPAMLDQRNSTAFMINLKKPETAQRAARIIELRRNELCNAVLDYIRQLESATGAWDVQGIFAQAHEIRGLAGTAGLTTAGRIADGLCQYLDAAKRLNEAVDPAVIALHVDAIVRASSSATEAGKFGEKVAVELSALVARKLSGKSGANVKQA